MTTYIKHWATDDTDWQITIVAIADALECGDSVRENVPTERGCETWQMLVCQGHITALGRRRLREAVFSRLNLRGGQGGFVLAAMAASEEQCHREEWGMSEPNEYPDQLEATLSTACRELNP